MVSLMLSLRFPFCGAPVALPSAQQNFTLRKILLREKMFMLTCMNQFLLPGPVLLLWATALGEQAVLNHEPAPALKHCIA